MTVIGKVLMKKFPNHPVLWNRPFSNRIKTQNLCILFRPDDNQFYRINFWPGRLSHGNRVRLYRWSRENSKPISSGISSWSIKIPCFAVWFSAHKVKSAIKNWDVWATDNNTVVKEHYILVRFTMLDILYKFWLTFQLQLPGYIMGWTFT